MSNTSQKEEHRNMATPCLASPQSFHAHDNAFFSFEVHYLGCLEGFKMKKSKLKI